MTYGENARAIRTELIALLLRQRIQQRLGGPGRFTVAEPTTLAEREAMGRTIQRYRTGVLTWCAQALAAIGPKSRGYPSRMERSSVQELRYQLSRNFRSDVDDLPLMDLLGTTHESDLLVHWQALARAAALGEHDFTTDVNLAWLTTGQAHAVAKDAADVIRAVVLLDRRYAGTPGWRPLSQPRRLNLAAEHVSCEGTEQPEDLSVDARGWRPSPVAITDPALPGVAGAVQAQHNMLVGLAGFPHALNLRRLLLAQAQVSHEAARHATTAAPELVDRFLDRMEVYRTLIRQTRNLGGLIGNGGLAVAEAQNAVLRLRRTPINDAEHPEQLHELGRLFTSTDARLASSIERGCHEQIYFVSLTDPTMTDHQINGVYQPRVRWTPLSPENQPDLLPIVRDQLRPTPPPPPSAPAGAQGSRRAYEALLAGELERRRRTVPRM
ncbi:MAG: hypothetical protein ABIR34_13770 [Marmoricola sp.]